MQLDLQSPEFIANPYPVYARLRDQAPVYSLEPNAWLITRYQDVEHLLKSPLLNKDVPSIYIKQYGRDMINEPVYRIHNNFWASMSSVGRRKLVEKWIGCGQADLMTVFAYPFPV